MNYFISIFILFGALLTCSKVNAQDCTLAISGRDADIIIQVFQMNNEQIAKMERWKVELAKETDAAQEQANQLLASQPQSTPEELARIAVKYKEIQNRAVEISKSYDKKLLAIFNENQYRRYVGLCREIFLKPLVGIPD
ncbi:hypothetical protein K8352_19310 [Flavobacteriaceae bacterium F89]|uniref:Uncharacterized protein n=1 Tax=Cerina litoralis TaxID=2874477 RepID=A0AAE3EXG2_9FLAO|nr:hypothetical protein [Cerina litoralis]MCG2462920.1 hypothetical protein [Cerina litoralis]